MNLRKIPMLLLAALGVALLVSCTHKPAVELPFTVGSVELQTPNITFQGLRQGQSWTEANAELKAHGFDVLTPIDYTGAPDSNQDGSSHASFHHLMVRGSCSGDFCEGYEPELAEGTIFVFFTHAGKLHGGIVQAYSEAYLKHEAEEKAQPKPQAIEKPKCFTIGGVYQITAGMSREELDEHFKDTPDPPLSCTKELDGHGDPMLDCVTGGMTDDGLIGWEFMIDKSDVAKISMERFPARKYPVLYRTATKSFGKPTSTTKEMVTWFSPAYLDVSCSDSLALSRNGREADLIVTDLSN